MTATRHQATERSPDGVPRTGETPPPSLAGAGDAEWLEDIFRSDSAGVYTIARRVLGNDADSEDVTQTSFIRAFTARSSLRDPHRTRPWLFRIAYREAIAVLRRRRELPTSPAVMVQRLDPEPGPEASAVATETALRVRQAIESLPAGLAAAVVLRDLQGLPMAEVAQVLGVGVSAAKMRVHRARTRLKVALHAEIGVG